MRAAVRGATISRSAARPVGEGQRQAGAILLERAAEAEKQSALFRPFYLPAEANNMNIRRTAGRAPFAVLVLLGFGLMSSSLLGGQSLERPEPPDWFAGDAHVHRGIGCGRSHEKEMLMPQQLLEMMKTNNLAVISVMGDIGNGEIKYADKDIPLMTGRDDPVSTPDHIVHWDAEWHYDPEGVTFERKVIGGHLILLGLKEGGQPFAQYTYPIFEWAKERGAIAGFAHMQYLPFAFYPPPNSAMPIC
jgi:hypothetical protein